VHSLGSNDTAVIAVATGSTGLSLVVELLAAGGYHGGISGLVLVAPTLLIFRLLILAVVVAVFGATLRDVARRIKVGA
jgi:hypothetical protein